MPDRRAAVSLAGFYFLYYAVVGITLPFLPAYLRGLGLSMGQVGALLALAPLLGLLTPPWAGRIADASGRPERVLRTVALGAVVGFAPFLVLSGFAALAVAMAVYAAFASCVVPLVDTLTLRHVSRTGGDYAHVRLFGSLGFVLASAGFGAWSEKIGRETVAVSLALIAALALWSFTVPTSAPPSGDRAGRLLIGRDLALFLGATCLHWLACAPYHGTFALLVGGRGLPPWVVGSSAALGVVAEIGVMALYPRFGARVAPRRVLAVAFAASALRWWFTAHALSARAFLGLALLHGLTFGAFYVAAVQFVAARVPERERAQGQSTFAAVTFGLGGLVGFLASGLLFDAVGGPRLFELAGLCELGALALAFALGPPSAPAPV